MIVREIVRGIERGRQRIEKEIGAKKEREMVKERTEIRNLHVVTHLPERKKKKKKEVEREGLEETDPGALDLGKGRISFLFKNIIKYYKTPSSIHNGSLISTSVPVYIISDEPNKPGLIYDP